MTIIIGSKNKAVQLRKQGKSYNEINRILNIPKSTLSAWLKTLPLSEQIKRKNINKAKLVWAKNITSYNLLRAARYKENYRKLIEKFSKEIPPLNQKSLFWIGLALFWAEGSKREKWSVRFVNSDPEIIKVIMRFFREICKVQDSKFRFRIYLHPNIVDLTAKKFWSKLLKVSKKQFYTSQKVISKASKRIRRSNQLPNGTLQIYVGDAMLIKKIKGWIKGLTLKT